LNSATIISEKMKSTLAFILHLVIALLAVPMLTLIFGGVTGSIARYIGARGRSPGQFYSDHVFLLTSLIGALLAYWVCETLFSRSAVWIWIPAVIAFTVRLGAWFSTGSVLFRGSVVEHFITAECPVEGWRDAGFSAHCSDKLLLMPLILGLMGYSIGAALQRLLDQKRRADALPS
jgi:uncharacterized membrane protein YeaQ/YmgE (transglycosylase-associated protein family)